jgi:hypothetical protein
MAWVALVAWIATAAGGLLLGGQWLRHGGLRQSAGIRTARLATHMALAVAGLVLWVVFLVTDDSLWAWWALFLLAGVVAVGVSMVVIWWRGSSGRDATELPAESAFPLPVVLLHGALGLTTLALVLASAISA